MLLDPTESRISKIGRWTFVGAVIAGWIAYMADFDLNKVGSVLQWPIITVGGYFVIQSVVVDPILAKLRDLEYKLDRLAGKNPPLE
jgi:hypothetical protein